MQLLDNNHVWELSRYRHEELLHEARQARVVETANQNRPAWWQRLLNRPRTEVSLPFARSATPELG